MRKKTALVSLFISFIIIFTACSNSKSNTNDELQTAPNDKKLNVYASFYPIYDFTNKIAGDKINLNLIIPAGAEPHHYEISAKTMAELEEADLIFLNGLEFEPWATSLPESLSSKIVNLGEQVNPLPYKEHSHNHDENEVDNFHSHSEFDPHIWLDPIRALDMSSIIYDNLSKLDSLNKSIYENNFKLLQNEFKKLDSEYQELKNIENKKEVIVSHNAFSYLSDRYGVEFHSVSGISPENEPSLKALSEISDLVKKEDIKVLFFEELANEKIINTLADETNVDSDVLYTIEGMTEEEIDDGEDYFSKMRLNLTKLIIAVQ